MRVEMGILSFCLAGATGCAVQDVATAESKKGKRRFSVQREGEIVALFFSDDGDFAFRLPQANNPTLSAVRRLHLS
ncbi:MAG TPA: hypothetical protein H9668_03825 [Firmicutes bacterium]|nr:hypothetical protein [Bacillota bacterium]